MIADALNQAAALFAESLMDAEKVKRFYQIRDNFENDEQLSRLREELTLEARNFQEKQAAGRLTQEDVKRIRGLQDRLNGHPLMVEYQRAQEELATLLRECNRTMNELLGFDFSATAIPAAAC